MMQKYFLALLSSYKICCIQIIIVIVCCNMQRRCLKRRGFYEKLTSFEMEMETDSAAIHQMFSILLSRKTDKSAQIRLSDIIHLGMSLFQCALISVQLSRSNLNLSSIWYLRVMFLRNAKWFRVWSDSNSNSSTESKQKRIWSETENGHRERENKLSSCAYARYPEHAKWVKGTNTNIHI